MKTRLVATVALASALPLASAQSSVALYGVIDTWVGQMNTKVGPVPGKDRVTEPNGGPATRWGLRGSEDLGGDLRAKFVLEQGVGIDTGTVSTVSGSREGFNRAAWIGLAGRFGEARLGRMLTAYDAFRGSNNQLWDAGFAATGQVWSAGSTAAGGLPAINGSDYLARGNNTAYYRTPQWGPVLASLSVSAGEGATTATASPRLITGHAEYASGPLRWGVSFQDEKYTTGLNRFRMAAARYDFGVARVVGNYQRQDDRRVVGGQASDEYQVGVDAPLGDVRVAVGYAKAITRNGAGAKLVDADGVALMAIYDLSKRTSLYAAARKVSVGRSDGSKTFEQTRHGVGITHNF